MKSFREFILESDKPTISPEDKNSYESGVGAFYHGVRAKAAFPGRSPGAMLHTYVHSETGEEIPAHHNKAKRIGAAEMTDEQKSAFYRGCYAQEIHELEPEKDRT